MKKSIQAPMKNLFLAFVMLIASVSITKANRSFGDHPYYLHALSDLRAARWLIEHRPGNWQQTVDEINAVKQIDAAIKDIKEASIEDNKNIDDHPPVDEKPDRIGRLHEAVDFLKKAHADIDHEEDDSFARGLRNRSYKHIDAATLAVKNAIHAN
jgi:hypothetical protein